MCEKNALVDGGEESDPLLPLVKKTRYRPNENRTQETPRGQPNDISPAAKESATNTRTHRSRRLYTRDGRRRFQQTSMIHKLIWAAGAFAMKSQSCDAHLGEDCVLAVQVLHVIAAHREKKLRTIRVWHAHVRHGHKTRFVVLAACRSNLVFEKPTLGERKMEEDFGRQVDD